LRSRLVELLVFDQHFSRQDEGLRAVARGRESAVHQKFVESVFQRSLTKFRSLLTTKVPALAPVQNAETILTESLSEIRPHFSTVFSTVVLKTFYFRARS